MTFSLAVQGGRDERVRQGHPFLGDKIPESVSGRHVLSYHTFKNLEACRVSCSETKPDEHLGESLPCCHVVAAR